MVNYKEIKLKMLFNFLIIFTIRQQKLADALAKQQSNFNKNLNYFIQVNIGNEIQKSGIPVNELDEFYNYCVNELNLKVLGLMIIPPIEGKVEGYFKSLSDLNKLRFRKHKYGNVSRLCRGN